MHSFVSYKKNAEGFYATDTQVGHKTKFSLEDTTFE